MEDSLLSLQHHSAMRAEDKVSAFWIILPTPPRLVELTIANITRCAIIN